ncbi:MAG: prephenate dehydratase [Solirubrobacteraceae bacterium]|jgi:prephenate dehydratase|nr:prephenate dehydratase [Solirubrobacteraceae bacterium]
MRLGYLGPAGTFSEEAVRCAPDAAGAELVALRTVRDTVMAVHEGAVQRAIVPIENSLEGPIGVTLDTLAEEHDVTIVGELVLAVSPCLIAREPLELGAIERVVSHPQPLAQCARFLRDRLPAAEVVAVASTAEAVRMVAAEPAPWAALGTRRAAEIYGATVLADGAEDEPGNATRFVWLARTPAPPDPSLACKTSLAFWGAGDASPGWLVRCLSEFAFRGVNLTKIESRPMRAQLGHYRFFVDCDGDAREPPVADAVAGLQVHCERVRVLGSYPVAG